MGLRGTAVSSRKAWAVLCLLLVLCTSTARASVNLPVHHWAYDALERLAVVGLIDKAMLTTKPMSRSAAAKLVAKAIRKIEADRVDSRLAMDEIEQSLEDLLREFQDELSALGVRPARDDQRNPSWLRFRWADPFRVEAFSAAVNSKTPAPPTSAEHADFRQPGFRKNFRGESFRDGFNLQSELRTWVEAGDHLSLSFNPKIIHSDDHDQLEVKELYGKLTFKNVDLEIGRDSMWWGPGFGGTLLLTDNARSFDMVKIGSVEPFKLPWVFRSWGDFTFTMFATKLTGNDGNPKLVGHRIGWSPVPWIELGSGRMITFGKEGRGTRFQDFLKILFRTESSTGNFTERDPRADSDERISIDFRALVPLPEALSFGRSMQVYGEIGGEDSSTYFLGHLFFQGGLFIPGFVWPGTDIRVEYTNTEGLDQPQPFADYNHGTFTSGHRFKGNLIGHNMGSNADSIFLRITQHLTPTRRIDLELEQQRHGIKNCPLGTEHHGLACTAVRPIGEKERTFTLGLIDQISPHFRLETTFSLQRLTNEGGVSGLNDTNHYLGVALSYTY